MTAALPTRSVFGRLVVQLNRLLYALLLPRFGLLDQILTLSPLEFVDGDSLRHILNRFSTISLRKAIQIAQQICAGLREAHAQGVIHRDLKPENLMLDHAGQVKIMDFGIARSIEAGTTNTGSVIGTPAYMAPEQAEGKAVDRRSDIYSLGLILYEMFTGSAAFSGDTPTAVALKQVREKPTPPRELDSSIPEVVENVILKCVEKDPAKRFQSVQELEIELTKVGELAGPPQHKTLGPRTRPHELEARLRPRPSAAILACTFAAGFVAASVLAWAWMIRHRPVSPWHDAAIIIFSVQSRWAVFGHRERG